jgi:hypothetical protein
VLLLYGATAAFVLASILLIREEKMLIPVLAAAGLGVWLGVQHLRYPEFSGGWLGLRVYLRRRQIARAEECIREASRSLEKCADFRSICQVLKENLQPMGIDGIRLKLPVSGTVPSQRLRPLRPDSDGQLLFSWSRSPNGPIVWQHSLQIASDNSMAASVFKLRRVKHSYRDTEVFSDHFRMTLSIAIERATKRIEIVVPAGPNTGCSLAADSLPNSA